MHIKRVNPAAAAMVALSLAMSGGVMAQTSDVTVPPRVVETDDGFDWGWLGLLGLIGLMGLKRRDTHHTTTTRTGTTNTTGTTGTNTGYTAPR